MNTRKISEPQNATGRETISHQRQLLARRQMPKRQTHTGHTRDGARVFTDIVGYSKLMIDEQTERLQELQEIVRNTQEFQRAQAANQLLRLPTGDGMALSFFGDPEAPVRCAVDQSSLKGLSSD